MQDAEVLLRSVSDLCRLVKGTGTAVASFGLVSADKEALLTEVFVVFHGPCLRPRAETRCGGVPPMGVSHPAPIPKFTDTGACYTTCLQEQRGQCRITQTDVANGMAQHLSKNATINHGTNLKVPPA